MNANVTNGTLIALEDSFINVNTKNNIIYIDNPYTISKG